MSLELSDKAIYIDSLQAYNKAIKDKTNSSFFTDDPVLAYSLNKQGVINVDSLVSKSDNFILGDISLKIADNIEYKTPPTIDDPAILTEIKEDLIKHKILNNG